MRATLAILTIGIVPLCDVLPLLTEHISKEQITRFSLLGDMSREEVMAKYAVAPGEEAVIAYLNDNRQAELSRVKISRDLQAVVERLDNQQYDVILLMSTAPISGLNVHNSILLEPQRVIPPLVNSIVDNHQVGVIVPFPELMKFQREKWQLFQKAPCYAQANPMHDTDDALISAGRALLDQGADVLMLDCFGFHQHHRDVLQKALDVPVLLSNMLIARLAAELLA